jgi:hypothetical protein
MQKVDAPAPVALVLNVPAGRVQFIAADCEGSCADITVGNSVAGRSG